MLQGGGLRGRLCPGLCARWRLSTALFRWMPDRFPFSVPGGLFVRRPSFPFRFRPSFPGLPFRIVISLVFSQPVGAPSFPCLPGFHLIYMRCFHVGLLVRLPCFPCVCPLFLCLLLFAILAAPSIFPFQFVPLFHCVFHAFLVCASVPVVSVFLVSEPPPLLHPLPLPYLSLLCVRLLTHALYFPCVSFVPNSLSSCCSLPSFLSPSLGFPFPLCFFCVFFVRVFSLVAPVFPVPFPLFPAAFSSSFSFVPTFSFPFSPFLLSPSSSIYKKVPS
jgi:hypothetical protein